MRTRAERLGYTQHEIMIVASIIEEETDGSDQRDIASVIYNRLETDGETDGYLQMDSTIQFILEERKEELTAEDLAIDSPYNTYLYPGLPEGPISNPGMEAIQAALYPIRPPITTLSWATTDRRTSSPPVRSSCSSATLWRAARMWLPKRMKPPMSDPIRRPLPELLAPAGDMERLNMAIAYGADAVYLAGSAFGMRAFAGNFDTQELYEAVRRCKARGVACHVTVNTMPRSDEVSALPAWLEVLDDAGVDAVIVADLGAFTLAGRYAPHVKRHISTQASVANYETARAWHDLGASRVILARELSLEEVAEIRAKTPASLELEAFVHGAMCVSYSGRCLLSNYMTGRDASRGACAQPCRYQYYLMEEKRPGEYFPCLRGREGDLYPQQPGYVHD